MFNFMFLITSLSTTSIKLGTGTVFNLQRYKSFNVVFKLFKVVGTLTNLLMKSFSTSVLNAMKYFKQLNMMYQRL